MRSAGIRGGPSEMAKEFYIDLRAHYRRVASVLSMIANYVLLVSVLAGVLSGLTSNLIIAGLTAALMFVATVLLFTFAIPRRRRLRRHEHDLESRRVTYNRTNFAGISEAMGLEVAQGGFRQIEPFEPTYWLLRNSTVRPGARDLGPTLTTKGQKRGRAPNYATDELNLGVSVSPLRPLRSRAASSRQWGACVVISVRKSCRGCAREDEVAHGQLRRPGYVGRIRRGRRQA